MSKGYTPPTDPEPTGVEEESVSNTQETLPLPIVMGERKIAVRWISRTYNQFSKEAPLERPGKK